MPTFKITNEISLVRFLDRVMAYFEEYKERGQNTLFLDATRDFQKKAIDIGFDLKLSPENEKMLVLRYENQKQCVFIELFEVKPQTPFYIDKDGVKIQEPIFTQTTEIHRYYERNRKMTTNEDYNEAYEAFSDYCLEALHNPSRCFNDRKVLEVISNYTPQDQEEESLRLTAALSLMSHMEETPLQKVILSALNDSKRRIGAFRSVEQPTYKPTPPSRLFVDWDKIKVLPEIALIAEVEACIVGSKTKINTFLNLYNVGRVRQGRKSYVVKKSLVQALVRNNAQSIIGTGEVNVSKL